MLSWPGECPECGHDKAIGIDFGNFFVCAECGLVYADDETLETLKNSATWMPSEFARRWGFLYKDSVAEKEFSKMVSFLDEMTPPPGMPPIVIRYICYHIHAGKMYVDWYLD